MTVKKSVAQQSKIEKAVHAKRIKDKEEQIKAKAANSGLFSSAALTIDFGRSVYGELDMAFLHSEVERSALAIQEGDLSELEVMLIGQAKALESMFVNLGRKANSQEYLRNMKVYMNLALKAQSQSRSTMQVLIEMKRPRQVIVTQQANISNGNQQVNNGVTQENMGNSTAVEKIIENEPNKLMESNHEENQVNNRQEQRLDSGTAFATVSRNS